MKILISFVGNHDPYDDGNGKPGPILSILEKRKYDKLVLLFNNVEKDDLKALAQSIPEWIKQDSTGSYSVIQSFLFQGISLYHKVGLKEEILYELLAENEDLILQGHTDESSFVRLASIGQKAQYLKQAKKDKESEKLLEEATIARKNEESYSIWTNRWRSTFYGYWYSGYPYRYHWRYNRWNYNYY